MGELVEAMERRLAFSSSNQLEAFRILLESSEVSDPVRRIMERTGKTSEEAKVVLELLEQKLVQIIGDLLEEGSLDEEDLPVDSERAHYLSYSSSALEGQAAQYLFTEEECFDPR